MTLKLDGPAVKDALTATSGSSQLSAEAIEHGDGTGEATVAVDRTWKNGWALTVYAKAWWDGAHVIDTGAGVKVVYPFKGKGTS